MVCGRHILLNNMYLNIISPVIIVVKIYDTCLFYACIQIVSQSIRDRMYTLRIINRTLVYVL